MSATDGSKARGEVTLMSSYEDLRLTSVGPSAFAGNKEIVSVALPEGVQSIGKSAFADCESLQDVQLPSSLKTIGDLAFSNCTYLASFSIPQSVTSVGYGAFSGCTDLLRFEFNEAGLTEIASAMFMDCTRLTEVRLPKGVTSIGASAFEHTSLTKAGNTSAVTTVADRAFADSRLAEFDFGSNLAKVGIEAFSNTALHKAALPKNLRDLGAGAFKGCASLSDITLGELTVIGKETFMGCSSLHLVELPSTLQSIEENAFAGSGLVSVNLGDNIKSLGAGSFNTPSLVSVTIGSGITSLASIPFTTEGMIRLTTPTPPALSSQRLGASEPRIILVPQGAGQAYLANNRWNEYNIVEENGKRASIYLTEPGTLATEIRLQSGCMPAQVTNISIHGELNSQDFAVLRTNMTSCYEIDMTDVTNTEIPDDAFNGKVSLVNVILSPSLRTIGARAFKDCALMNISHMPASVETIGEEAFLNCYALSSPFTWSQAFRELGNGAFANCYNLTGIDLKDASLSEIPESAFRECVNLRNATLPASLRAVCTSAFAKSGLATLELPSGLTTIGQSAFEGCPELTSLALPESVSDIGANAFASTGLAYITFPDALEAIADNTVADCNNLLVVNLPTALTELGSRALASSSISAISSPARQPAFTGLRPFDGIDNMSCGLSIPGTAFSAYLSAEYWGAFVDMRNDIEVTMDEGADLTYMNEDDYQTILGNDRNIRNARAKSLAIMRADGVASASKGYGRLFNGARLLTSDKTATRIFFHFDNDVVDYTVTFNSKDITSEIDSRTNSWVLPASTSSASLRVSVTSGVDTAVTDSQTEPLDIYTLQGICVGRSLDKASFDALPAGIYIVNGKRIIK